MKHTSTEDEPLTTDSRGVKTTRTGIAPNYTVISRDGKHAYVTNSGSGTLQNVIDMHTGMMGMKEGAVVIFPQADLDRWFAQGNVELIQCDAATYDFPSGTNAVSPGRLSCIVAGAP